MHALAFFWLVLEFALDKMDMSEFLRRVSQPVVLDDDSASDSEQNWPATRTNCIRTMTFQNQIDLLKRSHPEFYEGEPLEKDSDTQVKFLFSGSAVDLDSDHESDDERHFPSTRTDALPHEAFAAAVRELHRCNPELFDAHACESAGSLTHPLRPTRTTRKKRSKAAATPLPPMIAPAKMPSSEDKGREAGSTEFMDTPDNSPYCELSKEEPLSLGHGEIAISCEDSEDVQSLCSQQRADSTGG